MSSLAEYFHTDWAALTLNDWIGLVTTVVVFILMIVAYIYVFHPANREYLEAKKNIPLDESRFESEEKR